MHRGPASLRCARSWLWVEGSSAGAWLSTHQHRLLPADRWHPHCAPSFCMHSMCDQLESQLSQLHVPSNATHSSRMTALLVSTNIVFKSHCPQAALASLLPTSPSVPCAICLLPPGCQQLSAEQAGTIQG